MATNKEAELFKELSENKERYLKLSGYDEELKKLYDQLETARAKYVQNLYFDIASRTAYDKSLKEHKIDPFIAGGAAQGVAGLGAGLYAAGSSAARNDRIDARREYNKNQVYESTIEVNASFASLSTIMNRIVERLDRYDDVRRYRKIKMLEGEISSLKNNIDEIRGKNESSKEAWIGGGICGALVGLGMIYIAMTDDIFDDVMLVLCGIVIVSSLLMIVAGFSKRSYKQINDEKENRIKVLNKRIEEKQKEIDKLTK